MAPTFIWKFNVSAAREFCIVATPLLAAVWDNVMMFWFPTVCLSSECSMHVSDMGGGVVCVCVSERESLWVCGEQEGDNHSFPPSFAQVMMYPVLHL